MQSRLISLDRDAGSDSKRIIKIVELTANGKQIFFNKEFETGKDWVKKLKIRIRNISRKKVVYIGVVFGLLDSVNGQLESGASYQYGITFDFGKPVKNIKQRKYNFMLDPGKEADLIYKNVDAGYKQVLEKAGIERFHKAKFMIVRVQYGNGIFEDTQFIQ